MPSCTPSSRIAGFDHGVVNHRILAGGNVAVRRPVHEAIEGDPAGVQVPEIPGGGASRDGVEIGRVHLRRRQSLPAALRAAIPERQLRRAAVVRVDDRLGLHRHLVMRAVGQVDQLLGVAVRELRASPDVAGIGAGTGVSGGDRFGERGIGDRPGPSAVADGLKFAVPPGRRQPDFDLDVRIAAGCQRRRDATKGRQFLIHGCAAASAPGLAVPPALQRRLALPVQVRDCRRRHAGRRPAA